MQMIHIMKHLNSQHSLYVCWINQGYKAFKKVHQVLELASLKYTTWGWLNWE